MQCMGKLDLHDQTQSKWERVWCTTGILCQVHLSLNAERLLIEEYSCWSDLPAIFLLQEGSLKKNPKRLSHNQVCAMVFEELEQYMCRYT